MQIERICHTYGHFIVFAEALKEANSAGSASEPPTGALGVKSVGFGKLSSSTSKRESINHISPKSPAAAAAAEAAAAAAAAAVHKTAETQRWRILASGGGERMREATTKERAQGM